jgi:NAD+ kinase
MNIGVFTFDEKLYHSIDKKFKHPNPDLIVAIGGDGTFINCVRKNINMNIPFYGLANGTLNFLMNNHENQTINEVLELLSENKFSITFVNTPVLKFFHNSQLMDTVVNEIVIGDTLRYYPTFNVNYNGKNTEIKTSFMSVSTPLGSTGLNRNIGGIIIPSIKLPLYSFVSVASNKKLNFIMDETKGEKETIIKKLDDRYKTVVIVDNHKKLNLSQNDEIKITTDKFISIGFLDYEQFVVKRISEIIEK